jgi:enterochelin esterase-like enzyme
MAALPRPPVRGRATGADNNAMRLPTLGPHAGLDGPSRHLDTAARDARIDRKRATTVKFDATAWRTHSARARFVLLAVAGLLLAALHPRVAVAVDASPAVASGRVERLASFPSRYVDPRNVDVWLPDGYAAQMRCAVIYMQDGQMLFDPAITWNRQAWRIDATLSHLISDGKVPPTIVVAIWNNGKFRHSEYFPQKILDRLDGFPRSKFENDSLLGRPQSDNYLKFLVDELKPYVDSHFATQPDREHTFVAGSSMGAVISVYAVNEYPQVFGGAAALSVHWAGKLVPNVEIPLATFEYLQAHMAAPQGHRLYMDHGTVGLDGWYAPYQLFIDQIVAAHGYTPQNFQSRVFEGAAHGEDDWARRLAIPLEFLLGPLRPQAVN